MPLALLLEKTLWQLWLLFLNFENNKLRLQRFLQTKNTQNLLLGRIRTFGRSLLRVGKTQYTTAVPGPIYYFTQVHPADTWVQ